MLVLLRRQWKLYPITLTLTVSSLTLFLVTKLCWLYSWRLGAAAPFVYGIDPFDIRRVKELAASLSSAEAVPEAYVFEQFGALGIERLWLGDGWRLLVSAFHHATWWHLVGNLPVVYFLGSVMEERTSRWWYAAFFLSSAIISVLAEALHAQPAVGLSGTGYAIFGYLVMLRRVDNYVWYRIPRTLVILGIVSVVACIPIGWQLNIPVAHVAHFTGLIYGLLGGWAATTKKQPLSHVGFAFAHLAIVPLCLLAMKPTWSDHYLDVTARSTEDAAERVDVLAQLVAKQPHETTLRIRYVAALAENDQQDVAWRVALEGWNGTYSQSQQLLKQQISALWKLLPDPDARELAEETFNEVFADDAEGLKDAFDLDWLSVESEYLWQRERAAAARAQRKTENRQKATPAPTLDADDPDSAAFGTVM